MSTYEYKIVATFSVSDFESRCDELGRLGYRVIKIDIDNGRFLAVMEKVTCGYNPFSGVKSTAFSSSIPPYHPAVGSTASQKEGL